MRTVRIGYIPLMDAAVVIAAAECGFAQSEGLKIELMREVSWANIRDKLILDMFDAAHMLAPLAVATDLGLGHIKVPISVPFALNANGNCITIAATHYRALTESLGRPPADALESARAMGALIRRRQREGAEPLTFGVVFPFSVHALLIRHWLRLGGVNTAKDVQFVVVPPPYMTASLSAGLIDGYCVGDPWNSRAVEAGIGCIVAFGSQLSDRAPDKILAMRRKWEEENPLLLEKLLRALKGAAAWCADAANHPNLADILAQSQYLNVASRTIMRGLSGNMAVTPVEARQHPDFLNLGGGGINRPDPRQALWIYAELAHLMGMKIDKDQAAEAVSVYRPDLFDRAVGPAPQDYEGDGIGLRYGPRFRGEDLAGYLRALEESPLRDVAKG
jgi:NitT/TauT family transport system ATP-binding protein